MAPAWIEGVRAAGPLGLAAGRFVTRLETAPGEAPRGRAALVALAHAIDAFAALDAAPRAESDFVEEAGAFLGVVLIDALGDGAHVARDGVHRVRLGARGFFDPFAAIERALETEPARASLADDVTRAEREAAGEGPIARAAGVFDACLAVRRPDRRVVERFDRRVWLDDGVEVDLGRVVDALEGDSDAALAAAVDKLVSMLPGGHDVRLSSADVRARLLPRIVGPSMLAEVGASFVVRAMPHTLSVAYVVAYEGRSRFVRRGEPEAWGLDAASLHARAIENLAARSAGARVRPLEADAEGLVCLRSGDGLDAARLLLPGVPDVFAAALGVPFFAAIPHRDLLLAAPCTEAHRARLAARAEEDAARAPHAISAGLFLVGRDGLRAA